MLEQFAKEQDIVYKTLLNAIKKNTISHAYVIELNGYSKGYDFALSFAKFLLCPNHYTNNELCSDCSQCKTIDDGNFIELKIIKPDGQWIKKEQLEELQQEFNRKALVGNQKIYIIDGADKLNASSANSILKFLEEPVPGITAILLVNNAYQVMNTILSRCQILSLKKDRISFNNDDTVTSLAKYSFHNQDDYEKNVSDEAFKDLIIKVVEYITFFEKNGLNTIIYKNKTILESFNDKNSLNLAFEWFLLYYKDVLNYMLKKPLDFYNDYEKEIEEVSSNNTLLSLSRKIEIILKLKEMIKYNANTSMLMDHLIIDLAEVRND